MPNETETITLDIEQRQIKITVDKKQVIYFRKAEKEINDEIRKFTKKWNHKDSQDLLSKILVEFAVKWIEKKESLDEYLEDSIPMMEKLKNLTDQMEIDT